MSIYIACPPLFATGGTELLHQLHQKLKQRGIDSYIYYYDAIQSNKEDLIAERFKKYFVNFEKEIVLDFEDTKDHFLILPETLFGKIKSSEIKLCQWWLSVDNFFKDKWLLKQNLIFSNDPIQNLKNFLKKIINRFPYNTLNELLNQKNVYCNLYQSHYALQFIKKLGLRNPLPLSDFINSDILQLSASTDISSKENIIVYNPQKGIEKIEILKKNSPKNFNWIPIENMSPIEVQELFKKSKLYIDFGYHPGKDRIPREAAVNDCCIITNREGSAKNNIDIPIFDKYKFSEPIKDQTKIFELISDIFANYKLHLKNFQSYKNKILKEEQIFEVEIDHFLKELKLI